MRHCLPGLLILLSFNLHAQYDTSYIKVAFEYIRTEEFKQTLKNYTETNISNDIKTYPAIRKRAKRYKEEQTDRMNFWILNTCLVPERFYFIPDSTTERLRSGNSYKEFDTLYYNRPPSNCNNSIPITTRFISADMIELEHFSGQKLQRKWFGESNILKLKIVGGKIQFVSRDTIFWN